MEPGPDGCNDRIGLPRLHVTSVIFFLIRWRERHSLNVEKDCIYKKIHLNHLHEILLNIYKS